MLQNPRGKNEPITSVPLSDFRAEKISYDIHYEMEIGVIAEGEMERIYPGYSETIGPGQVWFSGMWEQHASRILKQPCTGMVIFIDPSGIRNLNTGNEPAFNWVAPFS